MVAFLKKLEGSEGFHQIVDFLNSTLTENPTIYVSLIYQFWQTASASTSENGEMEITATIDGRVKTVTEASIRRHLKLEDSDGISTLPNTKFFKQLALMGVYSLGSDEGSMTLHELTVLCTTLSKKVESLESDLKQTKLTYGAAYTKLIMKVKKLENRIKSSKSRRRLDEDEGITLVQMGAQTHGRHEHDLEPDFEFIAPKEVYTAKPDISTANVPVSTAAADLSTAIPKVKTTAESLVYIKRSAAKRKDKGKVIMKEAEPVQKKTKLQLEQERLGYEEALRLKEQLDEEERQRIARVHKEANTFNAEEWDNIQAQIEADEELAQKLQVEERGKFSEVEKARLLNLHVQLYQEYGKSHSTTIKEISFDEIKELFETIMERVKDFVPMESDRLVPKISTGSSKRTAKTELDHEGVGNHTEAYQTFDDMLKKFDKDDLDKLWSLVKERFSLIDPTDDKERTLWVELKRLFEPDIDDIL
ncbi:hypothetical protein Tco_1155287 [Tanacetum coccineum]